MFRNKIFIYNTINISTRLAVTSSRKCSDIVKLDAHTIEGKSC